MSIADQLLVIRARHKRRLSALECELPELYYTPAPADVTALLAIIDGDRATLREMAVKYKWGGGPSAFELNDIARKRLAE